MLKKIALVGANGHLGPYVLEQLLAEPSFTVTVLSRKSSKSTYSDRVQIVRVDDDMSTDSLIEALRGQDALVITMAGSRVEEQFRLADACMAAGVKRIIPADFGSCDSADDVTLKILPLYSGKKKVRDYVDELAAKPGSTLTWTAFVCGHFFDYGLKHVLLRFDIKKRKADILDGGDVKWSATNLATIGKATVRILLKEEETKNKLLYIQSFNTTQNEVLASFEKATGSKWTTTHSSAQEVIKTNRQKADEGDPEAVEEIVSAHGIVAANWEGKPTFANELLNLEKESLDEVTARCVREVDG